MKNSILIVTILFLSYSCKQQMETNDSQEYIASHLSSTADDLIVDDYFYPQDDLITDDQIADDLITDDQIADDLITDDQIADDSTSTEQPSDDSIADNSTTDDTATEDVNHDVASSEDETHYEQDSGSSDEASDEVDTDEPIITDISCSKKITTELISQFACDGGKKIAICHVPKGRPDKAHLISISLKAWAAHTKHSSKDGSHQDFIVNCKKFNPRILKNKRAYDCSRSCEIEEEHETEESLSFSSTHGEAGDNVSVDGHKDCGNGKGSHNTRSRKLSPAARK